MLKTFSVNTLYSYRTKKIALTRFCFFYLCLLISFCIKAGPEQQIDSAVFFEIMNLLTEQDRWIFKKLDQGLVPVNIGDRAVLLIIDPGFLINDDQCSELFPDTNTNTNIESYIALSIIRMLEKKEVKQEFINPDDLFVFSKEGFDLLQKIDELLCPLLEVEASDIYVDGSFEKNISKYAAVATFTFDAVTPICEIRYNHHETNQSKKNSYTNKYDITSDKQNSICSEINYITTELDTKEIDSEEIANPCTLNKYSHKNAESLSKNTHNALSLKPQTTKKKKKKRQYDCKVCGKKGLSNMKLHMFSHTKTSDFNCSACDKAFPSKYYLMRHINSHTKDGDFSCDKCSKRFHYKYALTKHELSHTYNHHFKCKKCDYVCTSRYFIRRHNYNIHDIHGTKHTHICQVCSKEYRYKSTLEQHLVAHTKERNFRCYMCNNTFKSKQILLIHMNTHTKEHSYACSLCNTEFTAKRSLQRHILNAHKETAELYTLNKH
ncbi:MAG: C2H2-type zinc finger protein [Candidatus Endonucleobacter bathymodioli]|uniref:C2H2-type zinc finger protein n=1 Tax=Candidatus Endonucleibacter bathymodioli TaxID=539814 RepID=A0AA90SN84_9GAMM|nr:C2H2-type zinc finger protein [Candidatus Endonucleobacter bathymodioli]